MRDGLREKSTKWRGSQLASERFNIPSLNLMCAAFHESGLHQTAVPFIISDTLFDHLLQVAIIVSRWDDAYIKFGYFSIYKHVLDVASRNYR